MCNWAGQLPFCQRLPLKFGSRHVRQPEGLPLHREHPSLNSFAIFDVGIDVGVDELGRFIGPALADGRFNELVLADGRFSGPVISTKGGPPPLASCPIELTMSAADPETVSCPPLASTICIALSTTPAATSGATPSPSSLNRALVTLPVAYKRGSRATNGPRRCT